MPANCRVHNRLKLVPPTPIRAIMVGLGALAGTAISIQRI
jgi:hypothetical protein